MIRNEKELLKLMVLNADENHSVESLKMRDMSGLDDATYNRFAKQLKYDGFITSCLAGHYITSLGLMQFS